jgi:hypothetical protein
MDKIKLLKAKVFGKQEILANVYSRSAGENLFDYVSKWQTSPPGKESKILASRAQELLFKIYPQEQAKAASAQLAALPLVSTIDHHGILNHPFFINSNLIFSLKKDLKYLICLSTSGVSLNNSSWPGSLLLTGSDGGSKRLSFFKDKLKTQTVFSAPAMDLQTTEAVLNKVGGGDKAITELKKLFKKVLANKNLNNFSSQSSIISSMLWSNIFPSAPEVIYLPVEDLVSRIIIQEIAPDPKHALHKLFFTEPGWRQIEKYFTGQLGAFISPAKGSFLFWAVDHNGRRLHLSREGAGIKGSGVNFSLSPEPISGALELRQIYPTSLVCFLVLLYYGITCVGGFNQVNWLTGIKEKFLELLEETGDVDTVNRLKSIPTQNFAEGNLAFLPSQNGLIKATGIDLYLSGRDYYPAYKKLAKSLTVGESMESLLPEIYRVITPGPERDPNLLTLSDADIIKQNGMAEKINSIK